MGLNAPKMHNRFSVNQWVTSPLLSKIVEDMSLLMLDFDGVFADTEPLHALSYSIVIKKLGLHKVRLDFRNYIGQCEVEIWRRISAEFGIGLDIDVAMNYRDEAFFALVESRRLQPSWFIRPLLEEAGKHGARSIVVSSQRPPVIKRLLLKWAMSEFDLPMETPYGSGVSKSSIIRRIAYNYDPLQSRCVLIEDNGNTLHEARMLGLRTVAVRHSLNNLTSRDADFLLELDHPPSYEHGPFCWSDHV